MIVLTKLFLAKLKAYDLDSNSVNFIRSYLANKLQRCKINDSFSEWENTPWCSTGFNFRSTTLNPFHATDLFWYPLKILENLWFSDVFRGYQKRSVAWNELNIFINDIFLFLQECDQTNYVNDSIMYTSNKGIPNINSLSHEFNVLNSWLIIQINPHLFLRTDDELQTDLV